MAYSVKYSLHIKFRNQLTKKSKGFTLVEVLIVMGIMSVMALAMTSMIAMSARSLQNFTTLSTFNDLVSLIQNILTNSSTCTKAMQGINASLPGVGANPAQSITPFPFGSGLPPVIPASLPQPYSSLLQITSFGFTLEVADYGGVATAHLYYMNLTLSVTKSSKISLGGTTLAHTFPVLITVDTTNSNAIMSCSALTETLWTQINSASKDIYNTTLGNVGIGTTTPQTTLDVNGSIRPGNQTSGQPCTAEGAMGYDSSNHFPVVCTTNGASLIWKAFAPSGAIMAFSASAGCPTGWTELGQGKFLVGFNSGDPTFNPVGKTGGGKLISFFLRSTNGECGGCTSNIPDSFTIMGTDSSPSTASLGSNGSRWNTSVLPPYLVVHWCQAP